jgi:hypothetical protein
MTGNHEFGYSQGPSDVISDLPEQLHKEFRSLSTNLVLATAFNNGGYPTLKLDSKSDQPNDQRNDTSDKAQQQRNAVLDAVASLLVRDIEVIAVAARDPTLQKDSKLTSYDIVAVHDFTVVQNPPSNPQMVEGAGHCSLSPAGTSHWPSIRDSKDVWYGLNSQHIP